MKRGCNLSIIRAGKTETRKSSLRLKHKAAVWDDEVRERMLKIRSIYYASEATLLGQHVPEHVAQIISQSSKV